MTNPLSGSESAPSISFKGAEIGSMRTIDVSEVGEQVQQRVYQSDGKGEPAFWPANKDGSPGKPKMAAVYNGVDENGDAAALWCPLPSDLTAKLIAAEKAYGRQIGTGRTVDRIFVKLTGREEVAAGTKSIYAVKIEDTGKSKDAPASNPNGGDDPWSSGPADSDEPPF